MLKLYWLRLSQVQLSQAYWQIEKWSACSCTLPLTPNLTWSLSIVHVVVCEGKNAASHASARWRAAGGTAGPATASGNPKSADRPFKVLLWCTGYIIYYAKILLRFSVNRRIFVVGFGLYGSIHGPTDYQVNIQVGLLTNVRKYNGVV